MNTSTTNSGKIMKLKLNCNEIFVEEISDECAYHLTQFFKNLAFAFETRHLFQISRHKDNMTHNKIEGDNDIPIHFRNKWRCIVSFSLK